MSDKIKVIGFDNIPAVQPLILDDKMLGTVEQYGAQMAVIGIDYALRTMKGEKFTGWVKTDVALVTKTELEEMMKGTMEATMGSTMSATMEATMAATAKKY